MGDNPGDNETQLEGKIVDTNAEINKRKSECTEVQAKIEKRETELRNKGWDADAIDDDSKIKDMKDKEKRLETIIIKLYNEKERLDMRLDKLRAGSSQPALVAQPVRARTPTVVHSFGQHWHACTICS